TKQLTTTLTVLMLIMLTVFAQMPANSTAASLYAAKETSASANIITVLPSASSAENTLSNSQPAVLQQLAGGSLASGQSGRRRKRLRKRHNANIRLSELASAALANAAELPLEWLNACGGQQVMPRSAHATRPGNNKHVRRQLMLLTRSLRYENATLSTLRKINIDDMHTWRLYSKKYRFLPSLNRTAKIELRHWHRGMQKFVASFVELGIKQYRWDQEKRQHTTELTHELNSLLLSAKRLLCEVETTLNNTHPHAKLTTITSEEMQKKLKFYSRDDRRVAERGVDPIDLKFAKQRYSKYVQRMFHIIRQQLRRNRAAVRASAKSVAANSNESSSQWAALAQALDYSAGETSGSESFAPTASVALSNEFSLGV
ncbi:PREDICTED: uncharacterized protein LOC108377131, partial [Rhagoletis zephyria]|uniref:uncharacterized protein LOC108377131 n=1 Tax=Rhagoletis zephyria TaxID=28612 RepID=UPI000811980F